MTSKQKTIPAARLQTKHVQNAKILTDRFHILQHMPKKAKVAELGVLGGDWARHILEETNPSELVLIDTYNSNDYPHMKRFIKDNHEQYIKAKFELNNDRIVIKKGLSWVVLSEYADHYFDWLYIDAAHDYDSVKKDLVQALLKLKPDGFVVMNDYIMYDHHTHEAYGVVQACNEFMKENNFEIQYLALHPEMFCDIVMRKIKA